MKLFRTIYVKTMVFEKDITQPQFLNLFLEFIFFELGYSIQNDYDIISRSLKKERLILEAYVKKSNDKNVKDYYRNLYERYEVLKDIADVKKAFI